MGSKRNVKRDIEIAEKTIQGASVKELTLEYGLSEARIKQIQKSGSVQEFIDEVTKAIALKEGAEAYKNISYAIQNYRTAKDPQLRANGFSASMELMRSLGVMESQKVSIQIQNITNTQNNLISPMMQELIQKHLGLNKSLVTAVTEDTVVTE